jgi:ElaB/YqjD/DUF883 family membrane-anchored ribosome-binding protein
MAVADSDSAMLFGNSAPALSCSTFTGLFMLETSMTKNAQGAAGDLTADLAALRQDVAHLAETMSQAVRHQTQAAGFRVSEAVGDARNKIASTAADTQNRVRAASREIEASIERNPLTAVLIAFGIGISRGIMSRSRG